MLHQLKSQSESSPKVEVYFNMLKNRNNSFCQKEDPIKRRASGYYSYQYDVGDQLEDVADSSEGDEELQFKIGIPGFRTIFGQGNHPLRRIFWIVLTIVCSFLAFYQVQECIIKYELENVINEVQIIDNETLIFPAVTMCNRWNGTTFKPGLYSAVDATNNDTYPSDLLGLVKWTANSMWDEMGGHNNNISTNVTLFQEMELTCWFGRNKSCEKSGDWEMVHTTIGPCYSFRIRQPVRETGLFNGLYIKMGLAKSSTPFDSWFYYIHPHDVTPALNIYETQYATKNDVLALGKFNTDVKVSYHQIQSLNVKRDRCVEDVEYTTELCQLECFSEQLVRHAGCLLPFMKLSHTSPYKRNSSVCNATAPTYRATVEQMKLMLTGDETIWNRTGCNCIPSCFKTYYETDKEKAMADAKLNRFRFRVFFQTRTYEVTTQKLEYGLINLFCALGNSIGLQLGVSVLTLCEALEWGAFKFIRCWLKPSMVAYTSSQRRSRRRRISPHPSSLMTAHD